jgi:carbonic anhydrase/acetyltransferase-like protein (isoleucine patch superfamily)
LRHLFILDQHVRAREAREVVTIGRRCLLHGATITIHLDV